MPTPTRAFADMAFKHGGVNPDDLEAVQHWYERVLPTLPPKTVEKVLEGLLENETLDLKDEPRRVYPEITRLPSLEEAPPVPLPLLAAGWGEFLRRLLRRHKPPGQSDT